MKRAPLSYRMPRLSKEKLARIREIERNFHVRAFGEELARVNLGYDQGRAPSLSRVDA
jgi:hypothetical protein